MDDKIYNTIKEFVLEKLEERDFKPGYGWAKKEYVLIYSDLKSNIKNYYFDALYKMVDDGYFTIKENQKDILFFTEKCYKEVKK